MTKKEQILEVALELFATQGVDKTATAEITKKAGVAEGTLFVHFKNKQALVDAIYVYIKEREFKEFESVLSEEYSSEENIHRLGKKVVSYFLEHNLELQFVLQVHQLGLVSPAAKKKVAEFAGVICQYLKAGQKEGAIKKNNLSLLCDQMWAMFVATIMHCKQHKKKMTDKMIAPIWDALKAQ